MTSLKPLPPPPTDPRLRKLYELAKRREQERQRMLKAKALYDALKDEHKKPKQ